MRVFHIFLFSALIISVPSLTVAQDSPYKAGMNYTAIRKAPLKPATPNAATQAQSTTEGFQRKKLYATPAGSEDAAQPGEPLVRQVWDKYKELAAGQLTAGRQAQGKEQQQQQQGSNPDGAPSSIAGTSAQGNALPSAQNRAQTQNALPPSGINRILEKYEQNKVQRRQLRSISIERPAAPDKPEVAAP